MLKTLHDFRIKLGFVSVRKQYGSLTAGGFGNKLFLCDIAIYLSTHEQNIYKSY